MSAFCFPQNENDRTRLFWDSFSWWASKHEFYDQIGISTTAVLSLPPDGRKREREFRAALDFEGSEAERAREWETLWKEAKAIMQQSAAPLMSMQNGSVRQWQWAWNGFAFTMYAIADCFRTTESSTDTSSSISIHFSTTDRVSVTTAAIQSWHLCHGAFNKRAICSTASICNVCEKHKMFQHS